MLHTHTLGTMLKSSVNEKKRWWRLWYGVFELADEETAKDRWEWVIIKEAIKNGGTSTVRCFCFVSICGWWAVGGEEEFCKHPGFSEGDTASTSISFPSLLFYVSRLAFSLTNALSSCTDCLLFLKKILFWRVYFYFKNLDPDYFYWKIKKICLGFIINFYYYIKIKNLLYLDKKICYMNNMLHINFKKMIDFVWKYCIFG